MVCGDPIEHQVQLLLGEDLGVGLGLFAILGEDLHDFLGGDTEIGSHLTDTILHKTHIRTSTLQRFPENFLPCCLLR